MNIIEEEILTAVEPRFSVICAGHIYEETDGGQTISFIIQDDSSHWESGATNEGLLEILLDRTKHLNNTQPCEQYRLAIISMQDALDYFEERTAKASASNKSIAESGALDNDIPFLPVIGSNFYERVVDSFVSKKPKRKDVNWIVPEFKNEWEEALQLHNSVKKLEWLRIVRKGSVEKIKSYQLRDLDNHTPYEEDWESLDFEKRKRVSKSFLLDAPIELPIVYHDGEGWLRLLSGNTRLNYARNNGYKLRVWLVNVEGTVLAQ